MRKWGKRPDLEAELAFQRNFHAFRLALAPRAGQGRDLRISYTWLEARSPGEVRQALQRERIADRIRALQGEELTLKMEDGGGAEIQILANGEVVRIRGKRQGRRSMMVADLARELARRYLRWPSAEKADGQNLVAPAVVSKRPSWFSAQEKGPTGNPLLVGHALEN